MATLNQVSRDIACYRAFVGTSLEPSYGLHSESFKGYIIYIHTNIKNECKNYKL